MKVVINDQYGGFSISDKALEMYLTKKKIKFYKYETKFSSIMGSEYYRVPIEKYEAEKERSLTIYGNYKSINAKNWFISNRDFERNDPVLIEVVEKLGSEANGKVATLKIIEIPDDVKFVIEEYDGLEHVAEVHRTWA